MSLRSIGRGLFRRLFDDDDALNEVQPDAVPSEVREWLAQTFTRSQSVARVRGERPKFRSVAHAVRAGLMVDRSIIILYSDM